MVSDLRRWFRRDDGATAIEFALLATPFFMLVLGIFECSMFFASGSVMEGAAIDAARLIRTGQVQGSEEPEETFARELCASVGNMLDCDKIQYQVIHVEGDNFIAAQAVEPEYDDEGNLIIPPFNAGQSSSVVIVRAYYKWTFLTPWLGSIMTGKYGRDWMSHLSTVVVKSEPYCTSVTGTCAY